MRKLGYRPSKADPDFWIRDMIDHYDHIARYVDDNVIVFSKDSIVVMTKIKKTYSMKDDGKLQYYYGGDIITSDEFWEKKEILLAFSAKIYIYNILSKLSKSYGLKDIRSKNAHFVKTIMQKWTRHHWYLQSKSHLPITFK